MKQEGKGAGKGKEIEKGKWKEEESGTIYYT